MTEEERTLFEKLRAERSGASEVFQRKDYIGFWTSIIDKYPESAHFIYELLQNADDALASRVEIELSKERLIFKHNGKIHFDITDVSDETIQGHINALTAIGNSNKKDNGNTIGKFGVGFKSVFQYTETPEIYDDNFKFKIVNRMIPEEIDHDHPMRKQGETLFCFPFRDNNKSYKEVKERLMTLDNPILFLQHIEYLCWTENGYNKEYEYTKEICEDYSYLTEKDLTCQYLNVYNADSKIKLLMFERRVILDKITYPINIAYYLNKSGELDLQVPSRIFCFFPTKEHFEGKHFTCHAPFLLVDSRQHWKPNELINEYLKNQLAFLEADSLPVLRDIGLKNQKILINNNLFELVSLSNKHYISYDRYEDDVFYSKETTMLEQEPMVYCQDGKYRLFRNCFFCHPRSLYDVITSKQLNQLMMTENLYALVSPEIEVTIASSQSYNNVNIIKNYCNYRGINILTTDRLASRITPEFMDLQADAWIPRLYRFLNNEVVNVWKEKDGSFRRVPFIKTNKCKWVPPFTESGSLNIFLPIEVETENYNIVHPFLLTNEQTSKFLDSLGIDRPSREDYIATHLLQKYSINCSNLSAVEIEQDFELILSYYLESDEYKRANLIMTLRESNFLLMGKNSLCIPTKLYLPTDILKKYFAYSDNINFFSTESIKTSYKLHHEEDVNEFLIHLGVNQYPVIFNIEYDSEYCQNENLINRVYNDQKNEIYNQIKAIDCEMEGLDEYLNNNIEVPRDIALLIWDTLCYNELDKIQYMKLYYRIWHGRSNKIAYGDSQVISILKQRKWLIGEKPSKVTKSDIRLNGFQENDELFSLFSIQERNSELKKAGLSDEEIESFELVKELRNEGYTNEELRNMLLQKKLDNQKQKEIKQEEEKNKKDKVKKDDDESIKPENDDNKKKPSNPRSRKDETRDLIDKHVDYSDTWQKQFEEMKEQESKKPRSPKPSFSTESPNVNDDNSSNDSVFGQIDKDPSKESNEKKERQQNNADINKSITEAQKNIEEALSEQDLRLRLADAEPYSFEWFVLILGLQKIKQAKENKSKNQTISFHNYSLSPQGDILLLSDPLTPIPYWAEDASSISLAAYTPSLTVIEDAKIISVDAQEGNVFCNVTGITGIKDIVNDAKKMVISCESPNSLLESLMIHFAKLPYEKTDNLKILLPDDIEFIYGPPGTGKTTELISRMADLIENALDSNSGMNILVLTPTNKAADVIVEDIIVNSKDNNASKEIRDSAFTCLPYAYRYGCTNSEIYREEYNRVKTRTDMFMTDSPINIVTTTIDRFPFDYVQPDEIYLCDYPWNYIICDEASMLDLVKLMYVLHKAPTYGTKFIIAGDPKQIPSVNITGFDYGNIYRCVGLDDMQTAINNFDRYPLTPLMTQYRSIPTIGKLVSEFSYNGLVKAHRDEDSSKPLRVDKFKFTHINFFGFKIKSFEMLYQRSSVDKSSINIYSVLYVYLMVYYIAKQLQKNYPSHEYSIGIVSPYRAESDAIRQLFENYPVIGTNCTIQCGTVHSFQGGQCDIMFVVMNPAMSNSKMAFVNTDYILNVAISRARDYLFFLAPEGEKDALPIMLRLHDVIKRLGLKYVEYKCADTEQILFGDSEWINHNTIVTGHNNVNTYSDMKSLFEIRQSDEAIDIRMINNKVINQYLAL